jgi:hypothetical protein
MIDLPKFELPFFAALLLLLVLARFFGELFERMKQPAMIGEIIAGIILGPTLLNFIHRTEELKVISDLGVFLLVILAGLEINFDDILCKLAFHFKPIGPTNFQFRFDSGNFKLLEINPRISSATSIRTKLGYNETKMSIDYFLFNILPTKIDRNQILKKRAIRYTEELILE